VAQLGVDLEERVLALVQQDQAGRKPLGKAEQNPVLHGAGEVAPAHFRRFARGPDTGQFRHLTIERLFVLDDLVSGTVERCMEVLGQHDRHSRVSSWLGRSGRDAPIVALDIPAGNRGSQAVMPLPLLLPSSLNSRSYDPHDPCQILDRELTARRQAEARCLLPSAYCSPLSSACCLLRRCSSVALTSDL